MIARHAPIKTSEPDLRKPGPNIQPPVLEFARAVPCEEGADDQGEWMVNGGREILRRLVVLVTGQGDELETK